MYIYIIYMNSLVYGISCGDGMTLNDLCRCSCYLRDGVFVSVFEEEREEEQSGR